MRTRAVLQGKAWHSCCKPLQLSSSCKWS